VTHGDSRKFIWAFMFMFIRACARAFRAPYARTRVRARLEVAAPVTLCGRGGGR
jgi:hypothetical protein